MSTVEPEPPGREPTPQEMAALMAERLGQTPVEAILLQTTATMIDCAGIRLGLGPEGAGPRDFTQARLAIEAARALLTLAEAELGVERVAPLRQPLSELQMLYARIVSAASEEGAAGEPPPQAADRPEAPPEPPGPDPASRLWVPPSARRGRE